MMRVMGRYVLVLALICAVAAATLAAVYEVTKNPIAASRAAVERQAIQAVLPAFDRLDETPPPVATSGTRLLAIYPAWEGERFVGTAVKVIDAGGYGGDVTLMVGVDADLKVHAIRLLAHKETPGLGNKLGEEKFAGQFRGLAVPEGGVNVVNDGGTIHAITGATISSRCATRAASAAVQAVRALAAEPVPAPGADNGRGTGGAGGVGGADGLGGAGGSVRSGGEGDHG